MCRLSRPIEIDPKKDRPFMMAVSFLLACRCCFDDFISVAICTRRERCGFG